MHAALQASGVSLFVLSQLGQWGDQVRQEAFTYMLLTPARCNCAAGLPRNTGAC